MTNKQCPYSGSYEYPCPTPESPMCDSCGIYIESKAKIKVDIIENYNTPSACHRRNILGAT